jgi:hypothetical protein
VQSPHLHLAVNHSLVLTLSIYVVYHHKETAVHERWEEDVIRKDGQEVDRALAPHGAEGVGGVVGGCPCICAINHAAVCKLVECPLLEEGPGSEGNEVLIAVGQSNVGVVPCLPLPPSALPPPLSVGLGCKVEVEGAYWLVGGNNKFPEGGGGEMVG